MARITGEDSPPLAQADAVGARSTLGLVDGGGLYFSRLVTAGPYAFFSGAAVDHTGMLAAEVAVAPPYHLSPAAHIVGQTKFIFDRLARELAEVGSSINDVLQVEQYIPHKIHADGYLNTSRGPGAMERGRPASAVVATGDLMPPGCVVDPTGIAIITGGRNRKEILKETEGFQASITRREFGESYVEEGPFNEVVAGGPYVFTIGDQVLDWTTNDIPEGVKVSDAVWWGSEIRNETEFLLDRLERYLARAEATLEDVVHSTIYLYDIGDYFEFDRVWRKRFSMNPPARTIVVARGLGVPRAERAGLLHSDKGIRIEHMTQTVRPGWAKKRVIEVDADPVGHESVAVKAGPLLWVSGLYASHGTGIATAPDARSQAELIFERLEAICRAAGTRLDHLVRVRAFVTDPVDAYAIHAAVRSAVPKDPPNVVVTGVPGPMPIPGCSLQVDAVVFVED